MGITTDMTFKGQRIFCRPSKRHRIEDSSLSNIPGINLDAEYLLGKPRYFLQTIEGITRVLYVVEADDESIYLVGVIELDDIIEKTKGLLEWLLKERERIRK